MKRLSILFLLIACMAVFSQAAQAAEKTDAVKEKLIAFGLIDKNFNKDSSITRAEFAGIMSAFFPEDKYDYTSKRTFSDVDENHAYAGVINKAAHYGIMGGVGADKFDADSEITPEQMQIALVKLLGYNMKAQKMGGYSIGYAQTAASLKLTAGIPADASLGEKAILMIDNALDIYVTEENLSDNAVNVSKEKTLMNSALGIYKTSGRLNGAGEKAIDERYQENGSCIMVSDMKINTDENMNSYYDSVGRYVDVYYTEDEGDYFAVWHEVRKTTEKTVRLRDVVKIENNTVTYKENNTNKTLKFRELPYIIYNNRPETELPAYGNTGTISFIDIGSGYDTIEIKDYVTYVVENASKSANTIAAKLDYASFKLDNYDSVNITDEDKKTIGLDKIAAESIISVLVSKDEKSIEIVLSKNTIAGKINEIDFDELEITIDDTVYPITSQFKTKLETYRISALYGFSGNFYLDICGNVAYFDMQADTSRHIGYLMKVILQEEEEDTRPIARILTDTGDIKDYRMKVKNDMISVDGEATRAVDLKSNNTSQSGVFNGFIITYSQNSKGEVKEIETASKTARDGLYQYASISEARYRRSELSFYNDVVLSEDAVIFHVPKEEKYKNDNLCYALLTTGSFNDNGKYTNIKFYALNEDAIAADAVVCEWSIEGDSANAYPMMISKITSGINADDEAVEYLSGEMYTGAVSAQSLVGSTLKKTSESIKGTIDETDVGKGDIVLCNSNFFGDASSAKLIYDCSADTYYQDNPYMLNDYQLTYILGEVEKRDGKLLKVKLANSSKYQYYRMDTDKIFVVTDAKSGNPTIETGSIDDIRTSDSFGLEASKIFIHASYNKPVFVVIYND